MASNKILKTIKIGLKVAAVSIVAGILIWIISAILSVITLLSENILLLIMYVLLMIPINFYILGWVATKLWKWK